MRVLLTGATGYIGSATLERLVRAGHEVTGLVHRPERAGLVAARGGYPVVGDLSEPQSYREIAAAQDGVIHAGFEASPRGPDVDRIAIETLIAAVGAGRGRTGGAARFLIYTSGVWILGNTAGPAAEDAVLDPARVVSWRPTHERLVLEGAEAGLRTVIVRPGIVFGGGRGIVADLFKEAANGLIRVVGTGENRWATVYDRDLAALYLCLVARPDASGVYHACTESDERVNDIVGAVAGQMRVVPEIRHLAVEEAVVNLGPHAEGLALDQAIRCPRARGLGWSPALATISQHAARLLQEWRAGLS